MYEQVFGVGNPSLDSNVFAEVVASARFHVSSKIFVSEFSLRVDVNNAYTEDFLETILLMKNKSRQMGIEPACYVRLSAVLDG